MKHKIGIIASDLTGAMDSAIAFAAAPGDTTVHLSGAAPACSPNAVIVTDSAAATPAEAYARARRATSRLHGRWLYKKIDSTLRGNIGPELRAVLDEAAPAKVVVCPALPREGRMVREGVALLDGVPVHLTAYGSHPVTPCRESDVVRLLRQHGIRTCMVELDDVRLGSDHLRNLMEAARAEAIVVDAESDEDLLTIAHALPLDDAKWVACGSSGLAAAIAAARGGPARPKLHTVSNAPLRALAVIGSRNPITVSQVETLGADESCVVMHVDAERLCTMGERNDTDMWTHAVCDIFESGHTPVLTTSMAPLVPRLRSEVARRLGDLAGAIEQCTNLDTFVLSGGATAWAVCRRLGVDSLALQGELEHGVVAASGVTGMQRTVTFVTKAGGFGDRETLTRTMRSVR